MNWQLNEFYKERKKVKRYDDNLEGVSVKRRLLECFWGRQLTHLNATGSKIF